MQQSPDCNVQSTCFRSHQRSPYWHVTGGLTGGHIRKWSILRQRMGEPCAHYTLGQYRVSSSLLKKGSTYLKANHFPCDDNFSPLFVFTSLARFSGIPSTKLPGRVHRQCIKDCGSPPRPSLRIFNLFFIFILLYILNNVVYAVCMR